MGWPNIDINDFFSKYLGPIWAKIIGILRHFGLSVKQLFIGLFKGFLDLLKTIITPMLETARSVIQNIFQEICAVFSGISRVTSIIAAKIQGFWNNYASFCNAHFGPLSPIVLGVTLVLVVVGFLWAIKALITVLIP